MKELRRIKNIRGIVTRLLVSFFFLFAAFLVKQFIVHYQMNQEENTFYVMNIAGRQRMLSQKITKDVAFLHEGETDYESELRFSLEQFQRSQERLIDLGEEDQLWYRDDHHILDLYEKINPNYQRLISLSNDYLREWNKPTPDEEKLVDYLSSLSC